MQRLELCQSLAGLRGAPDRQMLREGWSTFRSRAIVSKARGYRRNTKPAHPSAHGRSAAWLTRSSCRFRHHHQTPMPTHGLTRSGTSVCSTGQRRCSKALGLDKAVAAARSIEELRRITLDVDSAEIALAIRDALHPASGHRQEHFRGLREGGLKVILKNRFTELKKTREGALKRGKPPDDWTDRLILNKNGEIVANLANLILILCEAPKWRGVLGYNEFAARVVIRKRPSWGTEPPDSPWTDHHDSLVRVWFQTEGINPAAGDVGRAVQAAARHNPFHPVRTISRLARVGRRAPPGHVACRLFPCRRQPLPPRNRAALSDLSGRAYLSARLQGRPHARARGATGEAEIRSLADLSRERRMVYGPFEPRREQGRRPGNRWRADHRDCRDWMR